MTSAPSPAPQRSRRLLWAGVAGAALLMVAGGVVFTLAAQRAGTKDAGGAVNTVTLRDGACQPNTLTVPAGRAEFRIVNETDRAVEWEILDGVMVVEERENIAPGLTQTLAARLKPGDYAITCGLLSNPRGRLTVTAAAGGAPAQAPSLVAFIGPFAEYKVYLGLQANELNKSVAALDAAIRAGDLGQARSLYAAARAPYLRLAPVAGRFADLRNRIDPVAAYLGGREEDPGFTGFHRIEYGLFAKSSLDGLAPVAAQLVTDAAALKDRLRATKLAPADMGEGAARTLDALADARLTEGENRTGGIDLADAEAELAGVAKIVRLLGAVAKDAAPDAVKDADARLTAATERLAGLRGPDGFPPTATVPADARRALADDVRALARAVERMNAAVGLGGAESAT